MTVRFYEHAEDSLLRFAVIIARYENRWVFCKHRGRDTWEIPGGHREPGEAIDDTAGRELFEETGATDFTCKPLCIYSVAQDFPGAEETFGMLYAAEIRQMDAHLHCEIEKIQITQSLPDNWTYPEIQPVLLREYQRRLENGEI